mgnify:CR=1 FL=1
MKDELKLELPFIDRKDTCPVCGESDGDTIGTASTEAGWDFFYRCNNCGMEFTEWHELVFSHSIPDRDGYNSWLVIMETKDSIAIHLTQKGIDEWEDFVKYRDEYGIEDAIREGLEEQLCNGWYFFPGNTVAMHGSYILCENTVEDEWERFYPTGTMYYFDEYAIQDEMELLRTQGYYLLTRHRED